MEKIAASESIVVLKHAGQKAGLVVDTLLGEFQTVIKPLGQMFAQSSCISGSTILGRGDVALILDVPQLVCQVLGNIIRRSEACVKMTYWSDMIHRGYLFRAVFCVVPTGRPPCAEGG